MAEEAENRIEVISQQISRLQTIKHDQEVIIEHLAKTQLELENAGENAFSDKVAGILSGESKNHDALKEIISSFEIELNKLRSEEGRK